MTRYEFIFLDYIWDMLCFLDLCIHGFHQFWKFWVIISLNIVCFHSLQFHLWDSNQMDIRHSHSVIIYISQLSIFFFHFSVFAAFWINSWNISFILLSTVSNMLINQSIEIFISLWDTFHQCFIDLHWVLFQCYALHFYKFYFFHFVKSWWSPVICFPLWLHFFLFL